LEGRTRQEKKKSLGREDEGRNEKKERKRGIADKERAT